MFRCTRFGELLKVLPRAGFDRAVKQFSGDKYSKGFRMWDQLVVMMYAQLSGSRSLRELLVSYNAQVTQHYHLGSREIKRSTLADANQHKQAEVYNTFFNQLLLKTHGRVKRELKELLYLLDSTPIGLKGRGYEWTQTIGSARISGLKLHVLYAPQAALPCQTQITHGKVNDVFFGRTLTPEAGATYVFDKGYYDYNWWYKLDQAGARFVTRFKDNAGLVVEKSHVIEADGQDIIVSDETVKFKYRHARGGRKKTDYQHSLRRIVVSRGEGEKPLILVTNDLDSAAIVIAELYKQRWGIELWFKWIKQNLKIKRFLGCSENAVRIQLLIALITYLLAHQMHKLNHSKQSFYLWLSELKATLFQRRDLLREQTRRRQHKLDILQTYQTALPI